MPPGLDWQLGLVSVAGNDRVFQRLALFVLHLQWVTFVVDQDDFDLAIGAVVRRVGGAVGKQVLVADGVVDLGKVVGHLALEDGREAEASGHCCEGSELVLGLQVVEFANPATSKLVEHRAGADAEDGDVGRGPDLGEHLVEGERSNWCVTDS